METMTPGSAFFWGFIGWIVAWFLNRVADAFELPKKWKFKLNLFSLQAWKWIKDDPVEVAYHFKTEQGDYDKDRYEKIHELVKAKKFIYKAEEGNFSMFTKDIGTINPTIYFMPVYITENEDVYLASVEFRITVKVSYRSFGTDIGDVFRIREALQSALQPDFGEFTNESMTCKLSKMYRFSGLLSEFDISTLIATLHGKQVMFNSEEVIVMGSFNSDLIKLLKKAITFYY